jgi:NAD(P)-dependent dehydrogenase (short-subunit alcohol dehydrogenase family)
MKKFNGRVVLIIGTLSGIGKQVAIDFAKNGARAVIFVARSVRNLRGSKFSSAGNYGSLLF